MCSIVNNILPNNFELYCVDIFQNLKIAEELGIKTNPAFFIFHDGEIIKKIYGFVSEISLKENIQNLLTLNHN